MGFGKFLGGIPVVGGMAKGVYDAVSDIPGDAYDSYMDSGKNKYKEPGYQMGMADTTGHGMGQADVNAGRAASAFSESMRDRGPQSVEDASLAARASYDPYQHSALNLMEGAAQGNAPSAAMGQFQTGMNQAAASQAGAAGGARGGAGFALAQGGLGANIAGMQQQAANSAGMLRANEMAQARGMLGQTSGQARDQNLARNAQYNQNQQFNSQANDQYRMGMGQLAQGYGNTGIGYYNAATQAGMGREQIASDNYNQAQNRAAGINQANADARKSQGDRIINTALGLGQTGASAAMGQKR